MVGAFVAYWGWLGRDHEYQRDPLTGRVSGPDEAWQVAGCILTLTGLGLLAGALYARDLAVTALPAAFTVAWSLPAARADETGLWGVGALMILCGTAAGGFVLALSGEALRAYWAGHTGNSPRL